MPKRVVLQNFDVFAKPLKDFRVQTLPGGIITIICVILIMSLFISELYVFLSPSIKQELMVDVSLHRKILINFNIWIPFVPCLVLSVDSMDVSGEHKVSIKQEIKTLRTNSSGDYIINDNEYNISNIGKNNVGKNYCGSCYGASLNVSKCCNTCESVLEAYSQRKWDAIDINSFEQCRREGTKTHLGNEGCQIIAHLMVNKVAGSFHISPGKSYSEGHSHVHDLRSLGNAKFNLTHTINHLSFGETYPGQVNPLDGTSLEEIQESPMISYYLKLVPTFYKNSSGQLIETNQFSVTRHTQPSMLSGSRGIPGIFFNYEISPLLVKLSEEHKSLTHFLTDTCAIIGGVFTVASLFDAFIYKFGYLWTGHGNWPSD